MYERPPSYVPTAADEDMPAAAAAARWESLLSGCCWPIRAAMEALSRLGLEPHGYKLFRLATPIVARLAHADPSPRMAEQVLALWVREAEMNLRLDDHPHAGLNPDSGRTSPAAAVGPDDVTSAFSEMPALQHTLFNADMRETARSAPLAARRAFHAAMVAALEQVRASPNGVDIRDALALYACQAAARWAMEAKGARYRATYCAHNEGERRAAAKVAIKAMAKAEEAFTMAEYHAGAALAARGAWAAGAPTEGRGSASRRGDGSGPVGLPGAMSVEAQLALMAAWEASAAGGNNEPVEANHMPGGPGEEPDEMEATLNLIDGQWGANLTNGRDTCVPASSYYPWGSSLTRMPRLPVIRVFKMTKCCDSIARSLKIKLEHCRAGNAVLVKLVDQENLTRELEDTREEPNISISHVIFNGSHVMLPDGVALSC